MKRKIKLLVLSMLFVFGAAVINACGSKQITVSFKVGGPYAMAVNQEIELKEIVEVTGGEIGDAVFYSSNNNVLYVTPSQTIMARSEGEAILTAKDSDATLTIVVSGINVQFDKPTNVVYDETTNKIVWDAIYSGNTVANTYTVQLSKDGSEYEEYQVNKNYLVVEGNGEYKIKVACNERNGIQASEYSDEYSFTKLTAPTNLQFNDTTKTLTWDADESISSFYVKVNGLLSEKIDTKQYKLNLSNEENYEIAVMSCAGNELNAFGSTSQEVLTLTRLKAVEVKIVSGVVTWEDSQANVQKYKVQVYNSNNLNNAIQTDYVEVNGAGQYIYNLSNISDVTATYSIKVTALGDVEESNNIFNTNSHYLNSKEVQYNNIKKLPKPTITFNKDNQTVSVFNFDATQNVKYNLYVKYNQEQAKLYDISNGEIALTFNNVGTYEIYAINAATDAGHELNSEKSNTISVVKLDSVKGAKQQVNAENKYEVQNIEVEGATNYILTATHMESEESNILAGNGVYGDVDDIFKDAGNYKVTITAIGTDDVDAQVYYINSETTLNVHRLKNVELNDDGTKIYWNKDNSFVNIVYSYKLLNVMDSEEKTLNTEYIYSNLEQVGEYKIEVYETINPMEGQTTLILNSFEKSEKTFVIEKQIKKPTVSLVKEEGKYFLEVEAETTADTYSIYCNNELIAVLNSDDLKYEVTSCFNIQGKGVNSLEYQFKIDAKNSENKYYLKSDETIINVQKSQVPTKFTIDTNEKIIVNTFANWIDSALIIIDDEETDTIATAKISHNIKVKYIAKTEIIAGKYYLDSDFVEFTLNRDDSAISMYNKKLLWSTTDSSKELAKILTIEQADKVAEIRFNGAESEITTSSLKQKIASFVFDTESNFNATIQYILGEKEFNLNGEYVDGIFVSADTNNYYINSKPAKVEVRYPTEEFGLNIEENGEEVRISWNSEENEKFILYNDNDNVSDVIGNSYTLYRSNIKTFDEKNKNSNETENNITIEKLGEVKVVYIFTLSKLQMVNNIKINKEEQLIATQIENADVIILLNGEETTSVNSIKYSETEYAPAIVKAYYKAHKEESDSKKYYINSDVQTYQFARLTPTQIIIENNIMSWIPNETENENGAKYNYIVTFSDSDETTDDKIKTLTSKTNTINLNDPDYQSIIYPLKNNKSVVIRKEVNLFDPIKGIYELSVDNINYLSSTQSEIKYIKVLNTPTNVTLTAIDDEKNQNRIKVSWEIEEVEGTTINSYNFNINGNVITITPGFGQKEIVFAPDAGLFQSVGEWSVSIQAVGTNGALNSEYSNEAKIIRMNKSSVLNISSDGLITWSKNVNATKYILEYSYLTQSGIITKQFETGDNLITEYQLPAEIMNEQFNGGIDATLYTIGNGVNYLSNNKVNTFTRLVKPELVFAEEFVVVSNYASYDSGTEISIIAKIDGEETFKVNTSLTQLEDGRYVWYYPLEQFIENKEIQITMMATKSTQNNLNSNVNSGIVVMLEQISNLSVIKENGTLYFLANNTNAVNSYIINLDGTEIVDSGSDIKIELNDDVLRTMASNWTITAKAVGTIADKVYISSKISQLAGKKLGIVSDLKATNGEIVWNELSGAVSFVMKVDGAQLNKTYAPDSRVEKLEGFMAGSYNIQVKAIGNVGETAISNNIILDGTYSNEVKISKLSSIQNIDMDKGYFTFDTVENATKYIAYVYKYSPDGESFIGEYKLSEVTLPTEDSIVRYSGNLTIEVMKKYPVIDGEEIRVKFYAKTTEENFLYSDYSKITVNGEENDYLILKLLNNATEKLLAVHYNIPGKEELDYTTTYATWAHNGIVPDSDYLISINENKQIVNNGTTEIMLDKDGNWVPGKSYQIQYKQFGSSSINSDRTIYLTPEFSTPINVQKLNDVQVNVSVKNVQPYGSYVSFSNVENADKYYCYLNGEIESKRDSVITQMDLSDLKFNGEYNNFMVQAISVKQDGEIIYIAGNKCLPYHEGEVVNTFKKLNAPAQLKVIDGAFCWEVNTANMIGFITQGYVEEPVFVHKDFLLEQEIEIMFTKIEQNSNGIQYKFKDYLYKYIHLTDSQLELIGGINPEYYNKLVENRQLGYPSLSYFYYEFGKNIAAGEYDIQVRLIGDDKLKDGDNVTMLFSSNFNETGLNVKYIPSAPTIMARNYANANNTEGTYYIECANGPVNTVHFNSYPTYNLVGIYKNDEGEEERKVITSVTANGFGTNEAISFNITELINKGEITSECTELFVYVAGDDNSLLNGRPSNRIAITVLNPISAWVEHGVIKWSAQDLASQYIIDYGTGVIAVSTEGELSWYGANELTSDTVSGYEVSITAFGSPLGSWSSTDMVISGPKTGVGKVIKLAMITTEANGLKITNGQYAWVNNAVGVSGYDVFVSTDNVIPEEYSTIYVKDYATSDIYYETTVTNLDVYNYYFRTVGTESGELTSESVTYLNSALTDYNRGKRADSVNDFQMKNGVISWIGSDRNNSYKLIFNKITNDGESTILGDDTIVYDLRHEECADNDDKGICKFDTNSDERLRAYGKYSVRIQVYREDKNGDKVLVSKDGNAYYLISEAQKFEFVKFKEVTNINVQNGIISWDYEDVDNLNAEHHYELKFAYTFNFITKSVTLKVNEAQFSGVVFNEENMEDKPLSVEIFVKPGKADVTNENPTNEPYATSISTQHSGITQYNNIDTKTITVTATSEGYIKINWAGPDDIDPTQNGIKYQISYYFGTDKANAKTHDTNLSEVICGFGQDIEFNIDDLDESNFTFQIRRIPVLDGYISSAWTSEKEISIPKAVTGLKYENYEVVWDKYEVNIASDYEYKIQDEVTTIDEQGNEIVTIYTFTTTIGNEKFTPYITGKHKISVRIINKASNYSSTDAYLDGEIDFNLFDSGDGTSANPYIIKTEQQFNNIKYRLARESILNKYFVGHWVDEKLESIEVELTEEDAYYNFKQEGNLTIAREYMLNGPGASTYTFAGRYDANYNSITLDVNEWNSEVRYEKSYISLFDAIGTGGKVTNLNLLINFRDDISSIFDKNLNTLSVLCYNNSGEISNIAIGEVKEEKTAFSNFSIIECNMHLNITFIAHNNYHIIKNVQNYYNVNITTTGNAKTIRYSTIAFINYNIVEQCKNLGDIAIHAAVIVASGIIEKLNSGAKVSQCANIGNVQLNFNKRGDYTSTSTIFGGIIAQNSNGTITSCYAICNFEIYYTTSEYKDLGDFQKYFFIGGLIGESIGDNISDCYTSVTKKVISEEPNYKHIPAYQVIGLLRSSTSTTGTIYYKKNDVGSYYYESQGSNINFVAYTSADEITLSVAFSTNRLEENAFYPHLVWEDDFNKLIWATMD